MRPFWLLLLVLGGAPHAAAGPRFLAVSGVDAAVIELEPAAAQLTRMPGLAGVESVVLSRESLFAGFPDGRIERHAASDLALVSTTRIEGRVTGLALSGDGRFLLTAVTPPRLLVFDAGNLSLVKELAGRPPAIGSIRTLQARKSFLVAFSDHPELWEVPYAHDAAALPIYRGMMHDYRRESGEEPPVAEGPFPIRPITLSAPLDQLLSDGAHTLVGTAGDRLFTINLILGRVLAERTEPGGPAPARGALLPASLVVPLARGGLLVLSRETGATQDRTPAQPGSLLFALSDGRYVAAEAGNLRLIGPGGERRLKLPEGQPVALSAAGDTLLLALAGDRLLRVDLASSSVVEQISGPAGSLIALP